MKLMNKLKEKNNLPIVLFVFVLINYLPIFLVNAFTKEAKSVSMLIMAVCFCIEIGLLLLIYFYNIKQIKLNKKYIISMFGIMITMLIVQIRNVFEHKFFIMDIFNIGCIFINIFFFYIVVYDFSISDKLISTFFKEIVLIGMVAVVWNLVLYNKEILSQLGITLQSNLNFEVVKSFFPNRNSCAFYIYISIIANVFLLINEKNDRIYKCSILILLFGIWCTYSKTGYLIAILFLELIILTNNNYTIKKRILLCLSLGIIGIIGFLSIMGKIRINIYSNVPLSDNSIITQERVKRLSGRTDIWKRGVDILNSSYENYIFGTGRFYAISFLKFKNQTFSHFHNVYLELILTGGIIFFIYIGSIYFLVIKKIIKSDLKTSFKKMYIIMYITYSMYIVMESFGRFSIGYIDTLCIIFFITIPLLHANSIRCDKVDEGDNNDDNS